MPLNALEQVRLRSVELSERRSSNTRTALVVPGGVLQSICNCAALTALSSLGIKYFDSVYGVSAGAVNAAYFLADQAALGVTVYLEEVNRLRFVNPLRFWKIMDLPYLFTEVVQGSKALDLQALQANPSELHILTSDITDNQPRWFTGNETDFLKILRASCSPEVVSGRPVSINGHLYADGFLYEPLPLLTALKGNYTDILILLNKPLTQKDVPVSPWLQKTIISPWVRKNYGPDLVVHSEDNWKVYNQALEIIVSGISETPDGKAPRLATIAPADEAGVGMFETNTRRLFRGAYSSWSSTLKAFGAEDRDADTFLKVLSAAGLKRTTLSELQR